MKKILFGLMTFFILIPSVFGLQTNSKDVLLYNLTDDTYLYEQNSEEKTSIASLTKIMTSLVALEYIDNLDAKVTIKSADLEGLIEENASVAGFKVGEKVTYRDLLYGLLLPSGADAALALVHNTYKSEDAFIAKMNELKDELGMTNTHFSNTTGLDDDNNYATLKDLIKLLKYAINNETFYTIFTTSNYTTSDNSLKFESTLKEKMEKNNLDLDYILGAKTGTTEDAGLCLISLAQYNGTKFILATTKAPFSYKTPYNILDAKNIYDYYFKNYEYKIIFNKGNTILTLKTKNSLEKKIKLTTNEVKIYMDKSIDITSLTYNYNGLETLNYNNKVGDKIGTMDIVYEGKTLKTIDVFLTSKIHRDYLKYSLIVIGFIIVLSLFKKKRKKSKKKHLR